MLQMWHFTSFVLKFKSNLLVKRVFFLFNAAFAMAIPDFISHVHLPSFVNMLTKYLKHSTCGTRVHNLRNEYDVIAINIKTVITQRTAKYAETLNLTSKLLRASSLIRVCLLEIAEREITAVCSEMHIKHINTLCGQNVELLSVKPDGSYSNHWALNDNQATVSVMTILIQR